MQFLRLNHPQADSIHSGLCAPNGGAQILKEKGIPLKSPAVREPMKLAANQSCRNALSKFEALDSQDLQIMLVIKFTSCLIKSLPNKNKPKENV